MNILKKIPIKYMGELHQVKLINFSVEKEEVMPFVPENLAIRDYNGRALISMVNVQLRNMRPTVTGDIFRFNYQHIAFRLLVDDGQFTGEESRGIYFLRAFTDNPLIVKGGRLFTNYNLEKGLVYESENLFELKADNKFLHYAIDDQKPEVISLPLHQMVGKVDRAYAPIGNDIYMTQIKRDSWPIEWMDCFHFQTNFFETAQLEGAFKINEMIRYTWLPARKMRKKTKSQFEQKPSGQELRKIYPM